jgi:hypothetical protein
MHNRYEFFRNALPIKDPQTNAYDPSPLKAYFKALGIPYFFESQAIIEVCRIFLEISYS